MRLLCLGPTSLLAISKSLLLDLKFSHTLSPRFGVMHHLFTKIQGYALASTFVVLGGILNGYVLNVIILLLHTFAPSLIVTSTIH
jgi:hypothetical protein